MGANDAQEMLDACKAQGIADERTIALLVAERDDLTRTVADQAKQLQDQANVLFQAGEQHGILWRERHTLEQQLENVRRLCREPLSLRDSEDANYDVVEIDRVLEIIGTQPAASGDEHDRTA